ncbi:MAG: sigma-70 family RNA polymerase sigma factor [Planctomycetaceae bacterium]
MMSETSTDQQLITAINNGDSEAFAILYHRHRDWVVRLAFRFTGHHDDALDVMQETFAYLVRKFPGFELTAQMTTFLYPAVRNLSIAARKKRLRATSGDEDLALFACNNSGDSATDRDDFSDMLSALSDAHREILLMRFVDDMTQPEIAAALDLPLGTVKSRLHHAIQSVRESPAAMKLLECDQPRG